MSKRPPPPSGPPSSPKRATGAPPGNRPPGRSPPPKPNAPPPRASMMPTPNAPKAPPPPKGPPAAAPPPGAKVIPGEATTIRPSVIAPGSPPGRPSQRPPGKPPGRSPPPKPGAPPPSRIQPGSPSSPPPPSSRQPPPRTRTSPVKPGSPPPPKVGSPKAGAPPPPKVGSPKAVPPPRAKPPPPSKPAEGKPPPLQTQSEAKVTPPGEPPPPKKSPTGKPLPPAPSDAGTSGPGSPKRPPPASPKRPPPASRPPGSEVKRPPPASPPPTGEAKRPPPSSPPPAGETKRPPPTSPPPAGEAKRPPPSSPPPTGEASRPLPPGPIPAESGPSRPLPDAPPPDDNAKPSRPPPSGPPPEESGSVPAPPPDELESFISAPPAQVPPPPGDGAPPPPGDGIPPPPSLAPPPPGDGIPPPPGDGIPPPPSLAPPPPDMAPPPPPSPSGEASSFGNVDLDDLPPGRITIVAHEARDIGKRDAKSAAKATKIDPYIKMTLGKSKTAPQQKTKVIKRAGKAVNFKDEQIRFNVPDLREIEYQGNLMIQVQIWDSNMLSDTLLGQVDIPLVPLIQDFTISKWFQLRTTSKSGEVQNAGQLKLSLRFQPALKGGIFIKCVEGRNLKNMETFGKQDPYCQFEFGALKKKTKTVKKGGTDPSFGEEEVWFWIDSKAWINDIVLSCFDEDIGSDDLIGRTVLDVMDFFCKSSNLTDFLEEGLHPEQEQVIDIFQKGKKSGEIVLRTQFMPTGQLTITSIEGRNLLEKDKIGRQDPYIEYTTMGAIVNHKRKTKVDSDGGSEPIWNEETNFALLDHYEMTMEVYDYDRFGSNDLIGGASFSLLDVFKKGTIDTWVQLKHRDTWGKITPCGEIHLILDFVGPKGVSYPLRRPDIIGFDDSQRINRRKIDKEEKLREHERAELQEAKRFGLVDDVGGEEGEAVESKKEFKRSDEFNDDEIRDAFQFIDLNKNGFIGAAEIRHVLVCMGELITDEEVDEMISMVDTDGDGQVSFEEFYALIVDPDPGRPDFDPQVVVEQMQAAEEQRTRADAERRAMDMRVKNEKVSLMNKFARDNGMIDFDTFCDVMEVEATGEYSRMFQLFTDDIENGKNADYKAFLLGLNNFTGATTEMRVQFAFEMYDSDHNGFITMEELTAILKANHMASDGASVAKKATTIMKQADGDDDEKIDLDEFLNISRKFPNILFPATLTVA